MTISEKHSIITAIPESQDFKSLLQSKNISDTGFSRIKYGWAVVCCLSWIRQKLNLGCKDIRNILNLQIEDESKSLRLYNLLRKSTVTTNVAMPNIVGGNLILPESVKITKKDMAIAFACLFTSDGLYSFVKNTCNGYGANSLCRRGLKGLISKINFPIPSLACLLSSLGYPYITAQPYLSQGIMISKCTSLDTPICVLYGSGLKFYKMLTSEQFVSLAVTESLAEPISMTAALDNNIATNDYEG